MLTPSPSQPQPTSGGTVEPGRTARATLLIGTLETPFLRRGHGPPVVALTRAPLPHDHALDPESAPDSDPIAGVAAALATHRRVTTVAPPLDTASVKSFTGWLEGFMEGLGIPSAPIVASEDLALAAVHFALAHPDRVERLVLLGCHPPEVDGIVAGDVGGRPPVPLLILPSHTAGGTPASAAMEAMVRFLGAAVTSTQG